MGVELDSKENDLIAEYAAGVVLLHSHYYNDRYDKPWMYESENEEPTTEIPTMEDPTTEEPTTEAPTIEEPTTDEGGTKEDDTKPNDSTNESTDKEPSSGGQSGENVTTEPPTEEEELDLTEVFGTHPVRVSYVDYTVCTSYDVDPDGFFEILPDKGCSFLVLNFTLNNRSFVSQTVSTLDKELIIKLTINDEEKFNNYDASMLMNDLTVLKDTTLESGEEYKAVIIYMIPTEVAENIDSMFIEVASDMDVKGKLELQ